VQALRISHIPYSEQSNLINVIRHNRTINVDYHRLATIRLQKLTSNGKTKERMKGFDMDIISAIPVLREEPSYIAMLQYFKEGKLPKLHCVWPSGERTEMQTRGTSAENDAAYKRMMVHVCREGVRQKMKDLGKIEHGEACYTINVEAEQGDDMPMVKMGEIKACHKAEMQQSGIFGLSGCIRQFWQHPSHLETSGYILGPQWMEWNVMHGVEHFFFYARPSRVEEYQLNMQLLKPFLEQGLVTIIEMDSSVDHDDREDVMLEVNDCLYRAKGKSDWLMPTIEPDEYLVFGNKTGTNFLKEIRAQADPTTHSLSFGRFNFRHPSDLRKALQIQSTSREGTLAPLCPKYIARTAKVHALFNHWATSWDHDAQSVGVPQQGLVGFHYRLNVFEKAKIEFDPRISKEVYDLEAKIHERFGMAFQQVCENIKSYMVSFYSSGLTRRATMDFQEKQFASRFSTWIETFNRQAMNEVVPFVLSPPKAHPSAADEN